MSCSGRSRPVIAYGRCRASTVPITPALPVTRTRVMALVSQQVDQEPPQNTDAVRGEDRLRVELDAGEVRAAHRVHLSGRVGTDLHAGRRTAGYLRRERAVEAGALGASEEFDLALRALQRALLRHQLQAQHPTEDLVAQAHGEQWLPALQ